MFNIVDVVAVREAVGRLTPRQQHICLLLANGHSQEEIAEDLGVTQQTVAQHVERIRKRLRDMGYRGEAARHDEVRRRRTGAPSTASMSVDERGRDSRPAGAPTGPTCGPSASTCLETPGSFSNLRK
jgi:DNA-binding CsgD family transcriptional regulator